MTDADLLTRCRELIAEKLNWPPSAEWRNYEFNELSARILEETGIGLSTTTLKRLFGKVQYNNLPSSATLNALAKYLGYESWMQFKAAEQVPPTPLGALRKPADRRKLVNEKPFLIGLVLVGFLVACGFIFLQGKSPRPVVDVSKVVFNSRPLAEGLPNSVVFNVDVKGIKADTFWIQQYWDSTKTIGLKPGQTEATGIYYRPGYFRARLIADGRVLKEHDLFIRSDEWMATIDHEPVPMYLKNDELIINDSGMAVSPGVMEIIKKLDKPVTMTYHLVKPLGLQSDNFTFEASIKNTWGQGAAVCKTARVYILCTKGAFIIPFTIPGCVSDVNVLLNDKYLSGKENDLSAFGVDLSEWKDVKVSMRNKAVNVMVDGKVVYSGGYKEDAGEVVGMRVSFLGAGVVREIRWKDD